MFYPFGPQATACACSLNPRKKHGTPIERSDAEFERNMEIRKDAQKQKRSPNEACAEPGQREGFQRRI